MVNASLRIGGDPVKGSNISVYSATTGIVSKSVSLSDPLMLIVAR